MTLSEPRARPHVPAENDQSDVTVGTPFGRYAFAQGAELSDRRNFFIGSHGGPLFYELS